MLNGSKGRNSEDLLYANAYGTPIYANCNSKKDSSSSSSSFPYPDYPWDSSDPLDPSPSPKPYEPPPPEPHEDPPKEGYDVTLLCEWHFDQQSYDGDSGRTSAYINGVNKCNGHATEHVIGYDVTSHAKKRGVSLVETITMTISPGGGGGPCVFSISGPGCSASISGTQFTVARFEFKMNRITGKCTLKAL